MFCRYIPLTCVLVPNDRYMMRSNCKGEIILVKVGGSSITDKGRFETVNKNALSWFVQTIKRANSEGEKNTNFIIVHGAGSFGHHTAKEYGLKGISSFPSPKNSMEGVVKASAESSVDDRRKLLGLGRTRISVQTLNQIIVNEFLSHDIPAVGISPCFGIVHETSERSCDQTIFSPEQQQDNMRLIVQSTINAGLIPVLHGDAGLFQEHSSIAGSVSPAIISGDTIMQMIGTANYVTDVVFITDVDGVFTSDPKINPSAKLIHKLFVEKSTSTIRMDSTNSSIEATESSHDHDVTGGLKVFVCLLCNWSRLTFCFYPL